MNYFKDQDIEEPIACPEKENFLDQEEVMKGYEYHPDKDECIFNYKNGHCSGSCKQDFLEEITLHVIVEFVEEFGFKEYKTEETKQENGEIIRTTKVIKGVFTDEQRHTAVIHNCANTDLLPKTLTDKLENVDEITDLFEGSNYLLVKTAAHIYPFNIDLYRKIKGFISSIDNYYSISIDKHYVSKDGTLMFTLTDDGTKFAVSGIFGENSFAEEERLLLSQKVESAKPFFDFEPFEKVDWTKLKEKKGTSFENLCEVLLQKTNGIIEVQPIGKSNAADRGRDFIVIEKLIGLSGTKNFKWLVQCKYSEHSISPSTISGWTDRVVEHEVDGYWLMSNNDITPSLYDQLKDSERNKKFSVKTRIWSRNKFDIQYNLQKELFSNEFFGK